ADSQGAACTHLQIAHIDGVMPFNPVNTNGFQPGAYGQHGHIARKLRQPDKAGAGNIPQVAQIGSAGRHGNDLGPEAVSRRLASTHNETIGDQRIENPEGSHPVHASTSSDLGQPKVALPSKQAQNGAYLVDGIALPQLLYLAQLDRFLVGHVSLSNFGQVSAPVT